jgi:hypothetical protein
MCGAAGLIFTDQAARFFSFKRLNFYPALRHFSVRATTPEFSRGQTSLIFSASNRD